MDDDTKIRALLIPVGEVPREIELEPELESLQALVGGNIDAFGVGFGDNISLFVNDEGIYTCTPNRTIYATEEIAENGYLSTIDGSSCDEMGEPYGILWGDIVAVGFDPYTGKSKSLGDADLERLKGYFTSASWPGCGLLDALNLKNGSPMNQIFPADEGYKYLKKPGCAMKAAMDAGVPVSGASEEDAAEVAEALRQVDGEMGISADKPAVSGRETFFSPNEIADVAKKIAGGTADGDPDMKGIKQ